jgi:putative peptidoglycan lipid II flippase
MQQEDYRATLLIICGLAAASLTGLVRQAALAHQLGAGRAADTYLVAFAMPEFAFVALPIVLSPTVLPLFARRRIKDGEVNAWRFGIRAAILLTAILAGIALLVGLGAPLYINALAPGFSDVERRKAMQLVQPMLPAIVLQGLVVIAGAVLQVYRRFARPALTTAVYNLAFCAALFFLPLTSAVDRAAWSVLVGTGAGLLFQASLLWRCRPSTPGTKVHRVHRDRWAQDMRQLVRVAGPMAAGYAVHHAILLVDRAMATTLGAGRTAVLHYAYHLALVVGQVSGLAVSTALFPRMAEQGTTGDTLGMRITLADALRFVLMIGLPATCALVLLRAPVVEFLLYRGAFAQTSTSAVTQPLLWYGLAVFADALCQPLWRIVYAQHRPWVVLAVNAAQTVVRLLFNLALIPALGHNGLALSAAIGLTLQVGALGWWSRRRIGRYLTSEWWSDAGRVALATGIAASVIGLIIYQLEAAPSLLILGASGLVGGMTYWLLLQALGLHVFRRTPVFPPHPQ